MILASHPLALSGLSGIGSCSQAFILLVVKVQVSESVQDRRHQGIICLLGPGASNSMLVGRLSLAVNDGCPQWKEQLPGFFSAVTRSVSTC